VSRTPITVAAVTASLGAEPCRVDRQAPPVDPHTIATASSATPTSGAATADTGTSAAPARIVIAAARRGVASSAAVPVWPGLEQRHDRA
jgi:hypothetical protein